MNFANMNPAERLKASGLIGLIVVALFFVVHTMLGAVSPKSSAQTADPPPGSPPAQVQQPLGGPPTPGSPQNPDTAFPIGADKTAQKDIHAATAMLTSKDIVDPFVPLAKQPADTARPLGSTPVPPR